MKDSRQLHRSKTIIAQTRSRASARGPGADRPAKRRQEAAHIAQFTETRVLLSLMTPTNGKSRDYPVRVQRFLPVMISQSAFNQRVCRLWERLHFCPADPGAIKHTSERSENAGVTATQDVVDLCQLVLAELKQCIGRV